MQKNRSISCNFLNSCFLFFYPKSDFQKIIIMRDFERKTALEKSGKNLAAKSQNKNAILGLIAETVYFSENNHWARAEKEIINYTVKNKKSAIKPFSTTKNNPNNPKKQSI